MQSLNEVKTVLKQECRVSISEMKSHKSLKQSRINQVTHRLAEL